MGVPPFQNEPTLDFTDPATRQAMTAALARARSTFGREYPITIDGQTRFTGAFINSSDPAKPSQVVGRVAEASTADADAAIAAATRAFASWRRVPADARATCLLRVSAMMRRRRLELSALMVYEGGKQWDEADGEVAEAIDMIEYYARDMRRLAGPQPVTRIATEDNELHYLPLGVGVIIPPWNFPLAIMAGPALAGAVCGNTVVIKPSPRTPVIGAIFMDMARDAGIPDGVINYLPGGADLGAYLVSHPAIHFVNFTGSKDVGIKVYEAASKVQPGQRWLKRVVAEMGGKDAIVVDAESDVDAAIGGIVTAAFGYQGQKCSACSRAIVHRDVYDHVLTGVVKRAETLSVGPPEAFENQVGAVIDGVAHERILSYIGIGKREGRLMLGGEPGAGEGWFIQPTVFADVDPQARIAQEEIFGPVVAFIRADSFDDAMRLANDTEFGLTGSVYSRNRAHLERARADFDVGNLYFNRKCTGAFMGIHPFGGYKLSGTNAKSGGPDYLRHFLQAKSVSEVL
jgi:1-pyrroline-5-carboxylate dehydrogenase